MRNLLFCLTAFIGFAFFYSCSKEVSLEFSTPASGSLQSSAGDCLPKTVAGAYIANKPINDSNFIEVTVDVLVPGAYLIYTDSVNGYSFKASGVFTNTGSNTLRLKGSGNPINPGVNNFTVVFDSSFCSVVVTVLPAGTGAAAYSLVQSGAACASFTPAGNYVKDTTLNTTNTVTVQVNVTAIGTYSITTNTVNGYSFSGSGAFTTTGVQTVELDATGKPVAAGTDNFTVTANGQTCSFPITVTATAPTGCGNAEGTYTAGTALTAANKIVVTHTYATSGTFNVSTNTVNGYSFGPSSIAATAGTPVSITLNGTGTPTAVGINSFTLDFNDGTNCTFNVTVNPAAATNTDYFPLTANSYWTYNDGPGVTDTFKVTNGGPTQVFNGNTYQRFVYSNGATGQEFFRKDPGTGAYYRSDDTAGFGAMGLTFTTSRLDVNFLKNTLATGDSLMSDFSAGLDTGGTVPVPVTFRIKYKVVNANATITVNGKTFNNVYHLNDFWELGYLGNFVDLGVESWDYYYARGVGLIRVVKGTVTQDIRYWIVN